MATAVVLTPGKDVILRGKVFTIPPRPASRCHFRPPPLPSYPTALSLGSPSLSESSSSTSAEALTALPPIALGRADRSRRMTLATPLMRQPTQTLTDLKQPASPRRELKHTGVSGKLPVGRTTSVQSTIIPENEDPAARRKRHKAKATDELLNTEQAYVEDLKLIVSRFKLPMKESGILTEEQDSDVFINVDALANLNAEFLKILQEGNIGEAFKKFHGFYPEYTKYCLLQMRQLSSIKQLEKKEAKFRKFLEEAKKDPLCRQLDISTLLTKPFFRICKYPLLLKEIFKNCEESDAEREDIDMALQSIQDVISGINEKKRDQENEEKVEQLQKKLVDEKGQSLMLVAPNRRYVREDVLNERKANWKEGAFIWGRSNDMKQTRYILLNDMLLRAHNNKQKVSCTTMMSMLDFVEVSAEEKEKRGVVGDMAGRLIVEMTLAPVGGVPNKVMVWLDSDEATHQWLTSITATRDDYLSAAIGTVVTKKASLVQP